jgi:ubiquinone/menaquinone biosynthesis C-methylase UbiE
MENNLENQKEKHCRKNHHGAHAPTSFHLHNPREVFEILGLKKGDVIVDLGCGKGDYSIYASEIIGDKGRVFALDLNKDALSALEAKTNIMGISNLTAIEANLKEKLNLPDNIADMCLISTVLHEFTLESAEKNLHDEIKRILKPGGILIVIECKSDDTPFGPPHHMRISPEELEASFSKFNFEKTDYHELQYTYLMKFRV